VPRADRGGRQRESTTAPVSWLDPVIILRGDVPMASLWLTHLPGDITDDEIAEWLEKYGFPRCDEILRVPGDGSRPGAVVTFADLDEETLRRLQPRVDGMFVRNSTIRAHVAPPSRG
jgi:hypothetical protein